MFLHFFVGLLVTLFILVSLLLVLIILMQRSKQDGLGAAFGGGLTESVFGAQTSNILVRITAWLIASFFVLAIVLAYFQGHAPKSAIHERLHPALAPAAAAPVVAATPAVTNTPTAAPAAATPSTNAPAAPAKP